MGLGGRGGRVRANSVSHCTSTSLYSSMAQTQELLPISRFLLLTWIFLWSRCLAKLLRETLALMGSPALWFSTGIRLVSRVLSFGWKYFRAWKSLWMACPTTILSFKIFRIWKRQKRLDRRSVFLGSQNGAVTSKPTHGTALQAPCPALLSLPQSSSAQATKHPNLLPADNPHPFFFFLNFSLFPHLCLSSLEGNRALHVSLGDATPARPVVHDGELGLDVLVVDDVPVVVHHGAPRQLALPALRTSAHHLAVDGHVLARAQDGGGRPHPLGAAIPL
uniref:Uncharacterized protein n=1 Tax=Calidris pygmaea TaxID=425635 RepID=A0A8C3JWV3_9CHAR